MADDIVGISLKIDGTDIPKTVGQFREELAAAKKEMQDLSKAGKESTLEFKAAERQAESLSNVLARGNMRKALKEANQELLIARNLYGAMSDEAVAAAQKVANLKDEMGDAVATTEAFNPDAKFKAFGQAIQGVAGAFAGVQGAMALMGVESKEVEKQLLKVQGAMALSEGLNTVLESIDGFKNMATVIRTGAVSAFNTLRTAIGSTGIGLLVVGIGLLVSNFDSLKKYVTDLFPALNNTGKLFNDIKAMAMGVGNAVVDFLITPFKTLGKLLTLDFQGAIDEVKKGYSAIDNYKKGRDSEYASQAADASAKQLEATIKFYKDKAKVMKEGGQSTYFEDLAAIKLSQRLHKDDHEKLMEDLQEEREFRARHQKEAADQNKQAADKDAQERKQAADRKKAEDEKAKADAVKQAADLLKIEQDSNEAVFKAKHTAEELEQYQLSNKLAEQIALYEKAGKDTTKLIEDYNIQSQAINDKYAAEAEKKRKEDIEKELADEKEKAEKKEQISKDEAAFISQGLRDIVTYEKYSYQERIDALARLNEDIINDVLISESQRKQAETEASEARKEIFRNEIDAKVKQLSVVGDALNSFASLVGEQTAAGKAFAIAGATIATIQSAVSSYNSLSGIPIVGPALGAVAAAAAVASGLANIKKIVAVKIPGKGAGGSAPSISANTGTSAPAITSTTITNGQAPIQPTAASGGTGMNNMLGGLEKTQQELAGAVGTLNSTLQGGIQASVSEVERAQVAGQMSTINNGSKMQ